MSNGFVKTKIYDKRDDLDFDIVNFPFLDGDVPRPASYGVYISQLIRFTRVFSHVDDFNTRNKVLTAKLLRQGYRYHKLRKAFSKFYRRHFDIVSKYNVGLKTLLLQGLSGGGGGGGRWCWVTSSAGASYNLECSRARVYCTCSRCGWGWFGHFYSRLSFHSFFSLFLGDGPI